ncbi:MAG: hypothetical protein WC528_00155 [Patescibacteria group bacterium]
MGIEGEPNQEAAKSWQIEQTVGLLEQTVTGWEKPDNNEAELRRMEAETGLNLAVLKEGDLTDERKEEVFGLVDKLEKVADDKRIPKIIHQLKERFGLKPDKKLLKREKTRENKADQIDQTISLIERVIDGWGKPGHNEQDLRHLEAQVGLNLVTLDKKDFTDEEKKAKVLELVGELRGVADDERVVEITNEFEERINKEQ